MMRRRVSIYTAAIYVVAAAVGAVALDRIGDAPVTGVVAQGEDETSRADGRGDASSEQASDVQTADDARRLVSGDAIEAGHAQEVACSPSERDAIAAVAFEERDAILADVATVKAAHLDSLGLADTATTVIPDDVVAQLDTIDAIGRLALNEVDAAIEEATKICEAGGDPLTALARLS